MGYALFRNKLFFMKSIFVYFLFYFILLLKGECQHLKHYTGAYKDYNPKSIFSYKATVDYYYYKDKHGAQIYQNNYLLEVRDLIVDSLTRLTVRGNFNNNLKDGEWIAIHHDAPYSIIPDTITGYFTNGLRTGVWKHSKGITIQFSNNHLTGNIHYSSDQNGTRETINYTIIDTLLSGIYKRTSDDYESEIRYFRGYKYYVKHTDLTSGKIVYTYIVDTNSIISCIKDLELKKSNQQSLYRYSSKYEDDKRNVYRICYSAYDQKYYKVWQINTVSVLDELYDLTATFDIEKGSERYVVPYMFQIEEYNP